jgi:hypothetical protein
MISCASRTTITGRDRRWSRLRFRGRCRELRGPSEFGWTAPRVCRNDRSLSIVAKQPQFLASGTDDQFPLPSAYSVHEEVYRRARIRAAEQDTSVSALVKDFLVALASDEPDMRRLEREERELRAHIQAFTAGNRLSRDDARGRGE